MKKFLISIAFLITLFFTQNSKIVYAADLSDNFSAISVDNGRNNIFNNGDFAHITAKFNDRKNKFAKDSTMLISWDSDKKGVDVRAINETKNLVIKDSNGSLHEVGKYIVKDDRVQVSFNDEIEKFKNVVGQIDFDIQVKNNVDNDQTIQLSAGQEKERLYVSSQPQLKNNIIARITNEFDKSNNKIAWKISIDAKNKKKVQIINTFDGSKIDLNSLKVELNGKDVELNKGNFDHGLNLDLDGGQITVRYTTDPTDAVNVVRIISDKETSIYGEKSHVNDNANIDGQLIQTSGKDDQTKEKISQFLAGVAKLIAERKDKNKETEQRTQESTKQNADDKKQLELAKSVSKTGLKGFDTNEVKTKKKSSDKAIAHDADNPDEDIESTIKEPSSKAEKESTEHTSSKKDLPKTGEGNGILLSTLGIIILGISTLIFYKKFGK